ncbi:rod shape-determining protein MreD [Dolosicoccus paucivorans]|uniref:Rod shape-determining protein MreD n=1 Tax=Dolosicoccus paucivorans TaxID=84521 RepID=A0A1G8KQT6_9LACT|nr:rod shape-determining protein MreD [Dolosicoccus paucivorans]PMB83941.1 rod shape-determining protein MreD [Dolosicoccus paucivorans]PMC56697.1 rod shape-determining protein MreD [Dolosicoccus paucivorans]SDI45778.1 rod shape-determining protein MreD [Dolosicoccus paucivorans]
MNRMGHDQTNRMTYLTLAFLAIVIDSALPAIFPHSFIGEGQVIISHLTLYVVVVFGFYFNMPRYLVYSFLLGLLVDSYTYTILGLYATLYFLVAYFISKVKSLFPKSAIIQFMLFILMISFVDFMLFLFYRETGMTGVTLSEFLVYRLGPTLTFNVVLSMVLYYPTQRLLKALGYSPYVFF